MAELLVRRVDKVHADFYMNAKQTKRGDVITVQADGWPWGTKEVNNPAWIIIKVPGVDPSDLLGLLAAEPETDPRQPSKTLQPRAFRLDLDHPALAHAPEVINEQLLTALTKRKKPIADPTIIGGLR